MSTAKTMRRAARTASVSSAESQTTGKDSGTLFRHATLLVHIDELRTLRGWMMMLQRVRDFAHDHEIEMKKPLFPFAIAFAKLIDDAE